MKNGLQRKVKSTEDKVPYIPQNRRDILLKDLMDSEGPQNAGELNFVFTVIIKKYLRDGLSYQKINDILGALSGASQEFYRRVVEPYESEKIKTNGDVY